MRINLSDHRFAVLIYVAIRLQNGGLVIEMQSEPLEILERGRQSSRQSQFKISEQQDI